MSCTHEQGSFVHGLSAWQVTLSTPQMCGESIPQPCFRVFRVSGLNPQMCGESIHLSAVAFMLQKSAREMVSLLSMLRLRSPSSTLIRESDTSFCAPGPPRKQWK